MCPGSLRSLPRFQSSFGRLRHHRKGRDRGTRHGGEGLVLCRLGCTRPGEQIARRQGGSIEIPAVWAMGILVLPVVACTEKTESSVSGLESTRRKENLPDAARRKRSPAALDRGADWPPENRGSMSMMSPLPARLLAFLVSTRAWSRPC